ncbi:hypothetical protein Dsin_016700 [Dipteronia sinensis]|uniref:Helitron helicase-like domain-containing protein n=1 Tax=Dipteronia sinensis TaxID=43782 RepID=A0AAE0ADW6_9ROSI|nr:hypothetical protein Dsin_016700 [Dipteronia sinensis]
MSENCKDAFGICCWAGYPSLFITITYDPRWPEKRGLPHAHILLFVHPEDKPSNANDIDRIISAAIPDEKEDPTLFAALETYMKYGPCEQANLNSPCMKGGKCSKRFPKKFTTRTRIDEEGFLHYRRRDDGRTVKKKSIELGNCYVVPYNAKLLLKYQAHINVEYTCQTSAIKYLFNYVHKGNDRVTVVFSHSAPDGDKSRTTDEIQKYYDCRYVSVCEVAWRIFGFEIQYRYPPVQRLSVHLPKEKTVIFKDGDSIEDVLKKDDDNEYIDGIKEASFWGSAHYIKRLFANLLLSNSMPRPEFVWESCWKLLFDDILHHQKGVTSRQDMTMSDEEIKNNALTEVEKILHGNGKSLRDYAIMPFPSGVLLSEVHNKLILDKLSYDRASLTEFHKKYLSCLTVEQNNFYDEIMQLLRRIKGASSFYIDLVELGRLLFGKRYQHPFDRKEKLYLI